MNSQPLVSVIVITYNSAEFVLETLQSIKNQSYQNLELIITDDYSKDSTVDICSNWCLENDFSNFKIITSQKNLGIPSNCNRGAMQANGEWIKIIAGDDILLPDCIYNNINFIEKNNECLVLHSKSACFKILNNEKVIINFLPDALKFKQSLLYDSAQLQNKQLGFLNFINAPTVFIKKELLVDVGYFDEEFFLVEDLPLWAKITQKGCKIYYLNQLTVYYRKHDKSIQFSSNRNCKIYSPLYFSIHKIKRKYLKKSFKRYHWYYQEYIFLVRIILQYIKFDKPYLFFKILDRVLTFIFFRALNN